MQTGENALLPTILCGIEVYRVSGHIQATYINATMAPIFFFIVVIVDVAVVVQGRVCLAREFIFMKEKIIICMCYDTAIVE